ncbi:MAG: MFS transporter [Steroidobacteraceae bacterium]
MSGPGRWPRYFTVVLLLFAAVFISYIDRSNISVAGIAMQAELGWTETDKGKVLSAFFIGYLLMMAVSGVLANRYGGWRVLGLAVVWWSVWTMLTPPAALTSLGALVAARIALGLGEAAVFPASINMIGRWVPPERRTRATALVVSAISFGTMFSLPITGWLVRDHGWAMPFYLFGFVGFFWYAAWYVLARDGGRPGDVATPGPAPRSIPWKRIFSLPSVRAIIVAHFAGNWALYVALAWMPTYFKNTFQMSLADAGLLSAAPWLTSFVCANLAGGWADRMLQRGVHATRVRKRMQAVALFGNALAMVLLTQASTPTMGVVLMCCSTATGAFAMSGFAANPFDVAPKYADVIWGVSNAVATLPGVFGVYLTGLLLDRTGSFAAPFLVTAALLFAAGLVYQAYGSGDRAID